MFTLLAPPWKAVGLLCRRSSLWAAGWRIGYHSSTSLSAVSQDGKGGALDPLDAAVRPVVDDRAPDDQPRLDDDDGDDEGGCQRAKKFLRPRTATSPRLDNLKACVTKYSLDYYTTFRRLKLMPIVVRHFHVPLEAELALHGCVGDAGKTYTAVAD